MGATANRFVGIWQGEPSTGLAKITIEIRLTGNALGGEWVIEAGSKSDQPSAAVHVPILNPQIAGEILSFTLPQDPQKTPGPVTKGLRLTSDDAAVFEPILDPRQFDLNDPDIARAIESHRVSLTKRS